MGSRPASTATFTPDDNSTEDVKFKVKVPVNGGCTGTVVRLGNTNVSGAVIDAVGAPISGVDVFLFFALDGKFHPEFALKTRTDANGRFTFYRAEAAKFVLSAQLAASKMTFLPGTYDASKTRIIEVPLALQSRKLRERCSRQLRPCGIWNRL